MGTNLIPPNAPDDSGDEHQSPKGDAANGENNKLGFVQTDIYVKAKPALQFIGWTILIESLSAFLGQFAEVARGGFSSVLHCVSLCGFLLPIAIFFVKFGFISKRWFWISYFSICALIGGYIFFPDSKPLPKSHFTISLLPSECPEDEVKLTNNFLASSFGKGFVLGALIIPVKEGQTTASLSFGLLSDDVVESPRVVVSLPKGLVSNPDHPWERSPTKNVKTDVLDSSNKVVRKIDLDAWILDSPKTCSPEAGLIFPPFTITNIQIPEISRAILLGSFKISVSSKNHPAEMVSFDLHALKFPANFPDMKPRIVKYKVEPGNWILPLSEEKFFPLCK